jgi:hypothetical protein
MPLCTLCTFPLKTFKHQHANPSSLQHPSRALAHGSGAFILQQSVQWEFLDECQNELRVIFKGAGLNVVH